MGAIKGVGEGAVLALVEERKENGDFESPHDLVKRVNLRSANKRSLENMIIGGAWDSFNLMRSQYLAKDIEGKSFLDELVRFGQAFQQGAGGMTLFSDSEEIELNEPVAPETVAWNTMEVLRKEKEVIGMYISGHPLDEYMVELKYFSKGHLGLLDYQDKVINRKMALGGICTKAEHRIGKTGKPWGMFEMEDYHGTFAFRLFGETYMKYRHMMVEDTFLFVKGGVREKKWTNKEGKETRRVEFEITGIELLTEIREKLADKITIDLDLDKLDDDLLEKLNKLLSSNKGKGKVSVKFQVTDRSNKTQVELPSRTIKVDASNELLDGLGEMEKLTYRLN